MVRGSRGEAPVGKRIRGWKGKRKTQLSRAGWTSVSGSASSGIVKGERYPSAAAARALVRVSD